MKAKASFQCHSESDSKVKIKLLDTSNPVVDLTLDSGIDLTKSHSERRAERKGLKTIRRTDEVVFVDLHGSADYDDFFVKYIDPHIRLNVKGPFANLWWGFTRVDEIRESSERRVSINQSFICCIKFKIYLSIKLR